MHTNKISTTRRQEHRLDPAEDSGQTSGPSRFAAVLRTVSGVPSRRDVLRGLAAAGLGLGLSALPALTEAKPKRRKKRKRLKPVKPNRYGCLEFKNPCRRHRQCCSGICTGKPGRKRCRAHGAGSCNPRGPDFCTTTGNPGLLLCNGDPNSLCFRTTGGSIFCGATFGYTVCASCKRDADCLAIGLPAGSACVPVGNGYCTALNCLSQTACMAPGGIYPPEPV